MTTTQMDLFAEYVFWFFVATGVWVCVNIVTASILWTRKLRSGCKKCGDQSDSWFSRTEPMAYYCQKCGAER